MDLLDGLKQYKTTGAYYSWALRLEKEAEHILKLIKQYNTDPPVSSLKEVRQFLIEIEKWKAGCLQQRMGSVSRNSRKQQGQTYTLRKQQGQTYTFDNLVSRPASPP